MKSHVKQLHESKKPDDSEIKRPEKRAEIESNLKTHIEKVHESKKPDDSEIKKSNADFYGDNLKSHLEQIHESKKTDDSKINLKINLKRRNK